MQEHGFSLHNTAFQDALHGFEIWLDSLPYTFTLCMCSNSFSIDDALSCPKSGFSSIHHNEVCYDVEIEPQRCLLAALDIVQSLPAICTIVN